jgi:hypothetical protein
MPRALGPGRHLHWSRGTTQVPVPCHLSDCRPSEKEEKGPGESQRWAPWQMPLGMGPSCKTPKLHTSSRTERTGGLVVAVIMSRRRLVVDTTTRTTPKHALGQVIAPMTGKSDPLVGVIWDSLTSAAPSQTNLTPSNRYSFAIGFLSKSGLERSSRLLARHSMSATSFARPRTWVGLCHSSSARACLATSEKTPMVRCCAGSITTAYLAAAHAPFGSAITTSG